MFAPAPSQQHMLDTLVGADVDWARVEAFHMDEYLGLRADHPCAFGPWLAARLPVERWRASTDSTRLPATPRPRAGGTKRCLPLHRSTWAVSASG